jgi:hypothetical protein
MRVMSDAHEVLRIDSDVIRSAVDELRCNGFTVIKGLVATGEMPLDLVEFLKNAPVLLDGTIWPVPRTQSTAALQHRVSQTIAAIVPSLGLSVHPSTTGGAFRVEPGRTGLNWHQDHYSYYATHNHEDYLIGYIPLVKADASASNVAFLPYGVLKQYDPTAYVKLKGRGAVTVVHIKSETDLKRFRRSAQKPETLKVGDWLVFDNYSWGRSAFRLGLDIEQHRVVPQLEVGDLLLARADVLHRTEDCKVFRIALRFDAVPAPRISIGRFVYNAFTTKAGPAFLVAAVAGTLQYSWMFVRRGISKRHA